MNEEVDDEVAAARYKKEAAQSIANKAHKLAAYRDIDERFKFQVALICTITTTTIIIVIFIIIITIASALSTHLRRPSSDSNLSPLATLLLVQISNIVQ